MNVTVELTSDEHCDDLPQEADFATWAEAALTALQLPARDYLLSIALVSETDSADLNHTWRGKPGATNILSFPMGDLPFPDGGPQLLGDLAICPAVVRQEAITQNKTPRAHFAHLTVHGTLHLRGLDHAIETEAEFMERLESRIMTGLGFAPPYE